MAKIDFSKCIYKPLRSHTSYFSCYSSEDFEKTSQGNILSLYMSYKRNNPCDVNEMTAICEFLKQNPQITILDLRHNEMTDDALAILAENQTITTLDLAGNKISDVGINIFLDKNKTVTALDVACNYGISEKGLRAIAEQKHFIHLDIHNCGPDRLSRKVTQLLSHNRNLTEFNFNCTTFEDEYYGSSDRTKSTLLKNTIAANKILKNKREFVDQVITIAQGSRFSQTDSQFKTLPVDMLLAIFMMLAEDSMPFYANREDYLRSCYRMCCLVLENFGIYPVREPQTLQWKNGFAANSIFFDATKKNNIFVNYENKKDQELLLAETKYEKNKLSYF